MTKDAGALVLRIRVLLWIFIVGLVISGVTALPLETELRILTQWAGAGPGAAEWFLRIRDALIETNAKYPFIAYVLRTYLASYFWPNWHRMGFGILTGLAS
jgi:hypothetical protein